MSEKLKNFSTEKSRRGGPALAFEVREARVCADLQMDKDEVRRRRSYFLVQGQHWDYVDKRVLYTAIGAQILKGTAKASVPQKNAPAEDCAPARTARALLLEKNPPPAEFHGELVAWHCPKRNPKLLIAYVPGSDPENPLNLVSVHVRENTNFLKGMKLKAAVSGNAYDLVGPCPRWRGRW